MKRNGKNKVKYTGKTSDMFGKIPVFGHFVSHYLTYFRFERETYSQFWTLGRREPNLGVLVGHPGQLTCIDVDTARENTVNSAVRSRTGR